MINTDESALECDLAEVYHIYDYRELPASRVALFAVGLRDNSRIKLRMNNIKFPLETLILASIYDHLAYINWRHSKDFKHGINRPKSLASVLVGKKDGVKDEVIAFSSGEEFEKYRQKLLRKEVNNGNGVSEGICTDNTIIKRN